MRTMKGLAFSVAVYWREAPFNTLDGLAGWAAGRVTKRCRSCNHPHIFDVEKAAESQAYCDEIAGKLAAHGLVISELSTHLEGQLVAVNPVYSEAFDHFAPASVRGNEAARQAWATEKLKQAAVASARLGLKAHATFSGSLARRFLSVAAAQRAALSGGVPGAGNPLAADSGYLRRAGRGRLL